jgi:tight adherence protein C
VEILIAVLAGAAAFLFVAALLRSESQEAVQARLATIASIDAPTLEELELQAPLVDRTLRPLVLRVAAVSRRLSSPRTVSRTDERLARAGYPGGLRTVEFLAIKSLLAIAGFALGFVLFGLPGSNILAGLFFGGTMAGILYIVPEFWLRARINRRRSDVLLTLPDMLDLLTISVRAGLGFDQALARVVEKMSGSLADEMRRVLAEIRVGRPRRDSLRDLAARVGVAPLTSFVGAIVQAEHLGVPISKVLQVQSEQLRIERRQRAEEMAAKAPIKMLFPLVGCIFPAMFIVILGPAIILIMQNIGQATNP